MHWLLEHGAVEAAEGLESAGSPDASPGASPAHLAFVTRAAREFELPLDAVRQAAAMARRIRTGEGRWAWDSAVIDWQGNEVTLLHAAKPSASTAWCAGATRANGGCWTTRAPTGRKNSRDWWSR